MNRGSVFVDHPQGGGYQRFNEAPIHESGKSLWQRIVQGQDAPGFNEAPIHESGKYASESRPGRIH